MSEPTEALVVRVGWQIEGLPATIRRAGPLTRTNAFHPARSAASRLRWPDSMNPVSEEPGTVQCPSPMPSNG